MARVMLAAQLARWIPAAAGARDQALLDDMPGETVGEVLEAVFARHPNLRGYVLDEHGNIRHHVAVFVDADALPRKNRLDYPVGPQSDLHILQALSGG